MAYCEHCGKEVDDNAIVCIHCGCRTTNDAGYSGANNPNGRTTQSQKRVSLLSILGFIVSCVSVVLLVLCFVTYNLLVRSNCTAVGAVISAIGLADCKQQNQSGRVLSIIGIIISVISMFGSEIVLIALKGGY